jgi:hypothetical protein
MSRLKRWWKNTVEYGKELDKIVFLVPTFWGKGIVLALDAVFEKIHKKTRRKERLEKK